MPLSSTHMPKIWILRFKSIVKLINQGSRKLPTSPTCGRKAGEVSVRMRLEIHAYLDKKVREF